MKILLIDNYDSFTFNVFQYLEEMGNHVKCVRNDKIKIQDIDKIKPDVIFISPGPGNPKTAGICLDVVKMFAGKISIFGICLGHQVIGEAFGGKVIHAKDLYHGKVSKMISMQKGVFKSQEKDFIATRYHSLVIEKESLPDCFEITCQTEDGEIMGIKHKKYNIEGVQFHPESIMTDIGKEIFREFLERTKALISISGTVNNERLEKEVEYGVKDINLRKLIVNQTVQEIDYSGEIISIFEKIGNECGQENCTLLDSAAGPEADCNSSYIGINPIYEISIKNEQMEVITESDLIYNLFVDNFKEYYDYKSKKFLFREVKFSKIFSIISKMFELNADHNYKVLFNNGLIGIFSYEYLHYIETINNRHPDVLGIPDIHLKYFDTIINYSMEKSILLVISNNIDGVNQRGFNINHVINGLDIVTNKKTKTESEVDLISTSTMTKEEFYKKVQIAKKYIKDGDIFQIQIGRRLHIKKDINPFEIYKKLRKVNPSPYMFFWDCKKYQLISNSPELQLKIENGNVIIRPIAGTSRGKGTCEEEAVLLKKELANNPKEQAEHIMLVDLARNDIGKIATAGSVNVTELMAIEEFSHVFHIVSSVKGTIEGNRNTMELFESTFPAGTLTGAPKVRAMEIINELENEERGPYGGVFGLFDFKGNILSSIIIRTILRKEQDLYLHASAGIVADSQDYLEWNEIQHKTETIKKVLMEEI